MAVSRKRNIEHVLKPYEGQEDVEEQYHQKLFSFGNLKEEEHRIVTKVRI